MKMQEEQAPITFSPANPAFRHNPHAVFAQMRAIGSPVQNGSGQRPLVSMFTYKDVSRGLSDWRLYTSVIPEMRDLFLGEAEIVIQEDPPAHTANKAILARAFGPAARGALELYAYEAKAMLSASRGQVVEFFGSIARPLAAQVATAMIGLPSELSAYVEKWTTQLADASGNEFMDAGGAAESLQIERVSALHIEMTDVLTRHLNAGPVFPSKSLYAELQRMGRPLADYVSFGKLMIFASKHTTAVQLTNAAYILATEHALVERVRVGDLSVPEVVEEILRLSPVFRVMNRRCTADHSVGDTMLYKGDDVLLWIASANRDTDMFPQGDRFVPSPLSKRHLSFGIGPHTCLGAGLARAELAAFVGMVTELGVRIQVKEASRSDDPWVESFDKLVVLLK